MRKEEKIVKAVVFSSKTNVVTFKAYEAPQIGVLKVERSDVLTTSPGFVDDDNVGGFLEVWGE